MRALTRRGVLRIACGLLASVSIARAAALVAADFNNDGYADLAIRWARTVCVYLGSGDGTFTLGGCYPTGPGAIGLVTADLDSDGNLDLLVLSPARAAMAGGVAVLLGNGDGSFQSAQFYPVRGGPQLFSTGDLNADGIPDVAVVGTDGLCRLTGQGDGTLAPAQCLPIRELSNAHTLLTPDLNGDGRAEFVGVGQTDICVWPEATALPRCMSTPRITSRVAVSGQFTSSGNVDLALVGFGLPPGFLACVYAGDGTGGFQASGCTPLLVSVNLNLAASADLNGDGVSDLVLAGSSRAGSTAIIMLGDGESGFDVSSFDVPIAPAIQDLTTADLNGDGIPDLVLFGSAKVCSSFGDGQGGFGEPQCVAVSPPPA